MTVHLASKEVLVPNLVAEVIASALVLPTGEAILLIAGTGPRVPTSGQMQVSNERLSWQARIFNRSDGMTEDWWAIAVVETLPRGDGLLLEPDGNRFWGVSIATRIGASAADLLERAQAITADLVEIFHLLRDLHDRRPPADGSQGRLLQAFIGEFLDAVATHEGFIEIVAEPQTGGLFMQGWAQSLRDTPLRWISLTEPLEEPCMAVAFFDRPDLLEPARGVCLFHKDLRLQASLGESSAFFEQDSRLIRLELVPSHLPGLTGVSAVEHVVRMIPRLNGSQSALAPFQRICRPLFGGEDTLTSTPLPIAVGLDIVLRDPDGGLLMMGWLLDPDVLVEMVLIKSRTDRYSRISEDWVRLPRPDLIQPFSEDPRFAGRLGITDAMSGFLVRVPPGPATRSDEELYLELVLGDHRCLFRPLQATKPCSIDGMRQLLTGLSPNEPELARIIDDHLVPILSCLRPVTLARRKNHFSQPVPLGRVRDPLPVSALMPFASLDELQPVFSLLAGTPDGRELDLTLVASRPVVEASLEPLNQAFRFYDLTGRVLPAPAAGPTLRSACLDAALNAARAEHVLIWSPQALPKEPGWLRALFSELGDLDGPGMISPVLTYEDGSIRFGPSAPGRASALGFAPNKLTRSGAVQVQTAAAEIALIPRNPLIKAGGFVSNLYSDVFAHVDLSMRVASVGVQICCSTGVEFWCLDDPSAEDTGPADRILQRIDARLLVRRGAPDPKEHLQ